MAHPYHHARSTARRFGGAPGDYLLFHEFMDHTKAHLADSRHRILLHNSWGIFFTEKIFGSTFVRPSDRKTLPLRPLLEQHVVEDLGCIPTLEDCLHTLPAHPLPDDDILQHSQHSSTLFGGTWEDYVSIHREINAPRAILADSRSQCILHNSWGITLLLRQLGETCARPSDGCLISICPILEEHVRRDLGKIPTLAESLADVTLENWMYNAAQPLSQAASS